MKFFANQLSLVSMKFVQRKDRNDPEHLVKCILYGNHRGYT